MTTETTQLGLNRADFQRQVLGPYIDQLVRPLYQTELSEEELQLMPGISVCGDLNAFVDGLATIKHRCHVLNGVLNARLGEITETQEKDFRVLRSKCSEEATFYTKLEDVVEEGLRSGVAIPAKVACDTMLLERHGGSYPRDAQREDFDFDKAIEIMSRSEFDRILGSLTRGPNGFLGSSSLNMGVGNEDFFGFYDLNTDRFLNKRDGYDVKEGRVVGLSDAYYMSANRKRAESNHKSSSGCPVRHRFEDESGEKQEPLTITAKNFVVRALQQIRQTKA